MRKYLVAATSIATLTSLGLLSSAASAGGISTARFGGEHGHPTTFNPTAVYYNPAGIARSTGLNFFLDGSMALRGVNYERDLLLAPPECAGAGTLPEYCSYNYDQAEPADAVGANQGSASLFNVAAAPFFGTSWKFDLSEAFDLAVGAAFHVPFGGSSVWGTNDAFEDHPTQPGAVDGVNRWYSIHGTIRSLYFTGTVAAALFDRVYLGVSGNAVLSQVDSLRARNADGSSNLVDAAGGGEGRSWLKADGWNGSLGVGAMVEAIPEELFIGASYQSQPGFGEMRLEGTLRNNFAGTESEDEVQFIEEMPDIIRVGASWKPVPDWEVRLFGDWQRWSVLEKQCMVGKKVARDAAGNPIQDAEGNTLYEDEYDDCKLNSDGGAEVFPAGHPQEGAPTANVIQNLTRNWEDSFGIRAGVSYWPLEELEVFAGLGYDSNAVPDETLDTALLDFHDISAALGLRYQFVDWLYGAAGWTQIFYIPRDTTDTAAQHTFQGVSAGPSGGGRYSQWIGVLNVNLQFAFDPLGSDPPAPPAPVESAPAEPPPPPEEPAAAAPAPAEPPAEEPAPEEPAVEEPAPEEPAVEEPAPEEPAVEEPAPEEPAVEEPAP